MERAVNDENGITWTCIQAFTGVSDSEEKQEAAKVKGEDDAYWVVCTPSGGAKSVRLKLKGDWENEYSDEELVHAIENA